jgi:low affinity Fe/Cu permease
MATEPKVRVTVVDDELIVTLPGSYYSVTYYKPEGCAWAFGHPLAFILACLATLAWAVTGPVFNYSDTWQLVINTGTTVATFLMIFVLQHSQNRDATAIQAKLDELIRASEASNKLIRAEQLTEAEVEELRCDEPPELQDQKGARTSAEIAA